MEKRVEKRVHYGIFLQLCEVRRKYVTGHMVSVVRGRVRSLPRRGLTRQNTVNNIEDRLE